MNSKNINFQGDNSDIVATDSQKNTVYLLAKKHGVGNPEQFAILVAKHFIQTYSWVNRQSIYIRTVVLVHLIISSWSGQKIKCTVLPKHFKISLNQLKS